MKDKYIYSPSYRRAQYAKWERLEIVLGAIAFVGLMIIIGGALYVLGSIGS